VNTKVEQKEMNPVAMAIAAIVTRLAKVICKLAVAVIFMGFMGLLVAFIWNSTIGRLSGIMVDKYVGFGIIVFIVAKVIFIKYFDYKNHADILELEHQLKMEYALHMIQAQQRGVVNNESKPD
jgi:hypothetical protein